MNLIKMENNVRQTRHGIKYIILRLIHVAYIVLMLMYQDSHDSSQYMKYFALGAIIFAINVLHSLQRLNREGWKVAPFSFAYLLFIVYASVALLYGPSLQIPAYKMFIFGAAMFISYLIECRDEESRYCLMKDFWIGGVVVCLYILANYTTGLNGRTKVLGMNVINAGVVSAIAALFGLYLWQRERKKIFLIQIPLGISIVLLSGSKSALIAYVILFFTYILYNTRGIQKRFIIIILSVIIIICSYLLIMNNDSLYSMMGYRLYGFARTISGDTGGEDESRITMIKLGLDLFKKNPLFGVGFDCFRVVNGWTVTWSHCNYIEILSCFGLVGFIIYYFRYFSLLYYLHRDDSMEKADKALCYSIILCILVLDISVVNYYTAMYQVIFALVCTMLILHKNDDALER